MLLEVRPPRVRALPADRGQRRQSPVRRVHDQRSAPRFDGLRSLVHPEVVVAADIAAGLGSPGLGLPQVDRPVDGRPLEARRLLLGQELLVTPILRSLQGGDGAEVPDALQVGLPPRRAGRFRSDRRLAGRQHRNQRQTRDQDARRHPGSMTHSISSLSPARCVRAAHHDGPGHGPRASAPPDGVANRVSARLRGTDKRKSRPPAPGRHVRTLPRSATAVRRRNRGGSWGSGRAESWDSRDAGRSARRWQPRESGASRHAQSAWDAPGAASIALGETGV